MKWKNYGLWVSVASIAYMVFKDLGVKIDLTHWQTYVTGILGILATLGIISNPEKGKGYLDRDAKKNKAVLPQADYPATPEHPITNQNTEPTPLQNPDSQFQNQATSITHPQNNINFYTTETIQTENQATTTRSTNAKDRVNPHGMPPPPNEYKLK